jgi:tRNA pseudouridine38-40 synthase
MKNILLFITYDGSNYLGWQKTKEGPSIEEKLQTILQKLLQHNIKLQAASRTDAKVHAINQAINFFTDQELFLDDINDLLPDDIKVIKMLQVKNDFHPTLNCTGKEYKYQICNSYYQIPQKINSSWHRHKVLDIESMKKAASILIGTHDFGAFTNIKTDNAIRTIYDITIVKENDSVTIYITGNKFLYKMARIIVGTLVYVGEGKIPPLFLKDILEKKDRKLAGITAPAKGLFLNEIFYPDFYNINIKQIG